jgi:cyclase
VKPKIRIIPTILYNNTLVKGKKFKSWRVVGNLFQMIKLYSLREVDELIFFDIEASKKGYLELSLIDEFADECFMPLTIGGGIKKLKDIDDLLKVGADKVCINSAATYNLEFIRQAIKKFGSQCIVISVDYKLNKKNNLEVFKNSGTVGTGLLLHEYVKKISDLGPGEIILTSIDHDGEMKGYDIKTLLNINSISSSSIIASGGAGNCDDIYKVIERTGITTISAASIFHFTEITPMDVKRYLKEKGLNVRL